MYLSSASKRSGVILSPARRLVSSAERRPSAVRRSRTYRSSALRRSSRSKPIWSLSRAEGLTARAPRPAPGRTEVPSSGGRGCTRRLSPNCPPAQAIPPALTALSGARGRDEGRWAVRNRHSVHSLRFWHKEARQRISEGGLTRCQFSDGRDRTRTWYMNQAAGRRQREKSRGNQNRRGKLMR